MYKLRKAKEIVVGNRLGKVSALKEVQLVATVYHVAQDDRGDIVARYITNEGVLETARWEPNQLIVVQA